jgi:hypothetical protein
VGYGIPVKGIDSLTQLEHSMQKTMLAKYPGTCAISGAPIRVGDEITYDTVARKAWITDEDEGRLTYQSSDRYVSNVFNVGGREYYRNKQGLCIDAPCCGCCTV